MPAKKSLVLWSMILLLFTGSLRAGAQNVNDLRHRLQNAAGGVPRAIILLRLAEYYGVDNPDSTNYFTEQSAQIKDATKIDTISNRIKALQALGYCIKTKPKNTGAVFNPVIALCRQTKDLRNEMRTLRFWADYIFKYDTALTTALRCHQRIIVIARQLKDVNQEFQSRISIADFYGIRNDNYNSEKQLMAVLTDKRLQHSDQLEHAYDLATSLYSSKGDYPNALLYALKSEKYMDATGDTSSIFNLYGRLVTIYGSLAMIDKAVYYNKKAMSNLIAIRRTDFIFKVGSGMVFYMIKQKKAAEALKFINDLRARYKFHDADDPILFQKDLGNCYTELKDLAKAGAAYKEMIRLGEVADPAVFPAEEKAINYHTIGNFYLQTRQYGLAKNALLKSLNALHGKGSAVHLQTLYFSLFKADSALGNYLPAIRYMQRRYAIKDSINSVQRIKQIAKMESAYQSEKKDKEIQLSQARIKADGLEKDSLKATRDWILAGLVVLLLVSGLLYRLTRIRKKNNRQINAKNQLLQKLLEEKEWLVKEIHHRVKNNLHTVICLLESQAAYLANDALEAIDNSRHRIYAMSMIHQKLYITDDVRMIDMKDYISEFVQYLADSFGSPDNISVRMNIDKVRLSAGQAIPVGLIINEAVTNCFKYAFPGKTGGKIEIKLTRDDDDIMLKIADDGVGLPTREKNRPESLGLNLIKGLSGDLKGKVAFTVSNGTAITLHFTIDHLQEKEHEPQLFYNLSAS